MALTAAENIAADKLPPVVWKTIQAHTAGRQPSSIQKEDANGTIIYEVAFSVGTAQERTLTVAESGAVLSEQISLPETPVAVQKAITTAIGGGSIDGIDRVTDAGETTYDVDFSNKAGQERHLSVAEDGSLLSLQVELDETPPVVQTAVNQQRIEGKLSQVEKIFDENTVSYEVSYTLQNGDERSVVIAADGHRMSLELSLDQATQPAQEAIRKHIGAGRILRINAHFGPEGKKVSFYEVEGVADGNPTAFKVGPKGKYLGTLD